MQPETARNERLSIKEAAEHAQCSTTKIRRLIHAGTLPATRCGRPYYIERADLENLFAPVPVSDEERMAALAREIAANAPKLSPERRARLAELLR